MATRQTGPLSLRARAEVLEHRMRVGESRWCFPSPVQDGPISYYALNEAWHRVLDKAGMPPLRLHDLRHARATQLIGLNVATEKVQCLGRWKSRTSIDRYIHMQADHAAGALDAAEALPDEATVKDIKSRATKRATEPKQ